MEKAWAKAIQNLTKFGCKSNRKKENGRTREESK
jgi:hypothetical protein